MSTRRASYAVDIVVRSNRVRGKVVFLAYVFRGIAPVQCKAHYHISLTTCVRLLPRVDDIPSMRRNLQSSWDKRVEVTQTTMKTDLQLSLPIEVYILRLDVAMGNTLRVEVRKTLQYLPEATLDFAR